MRRCGGASRTSTSRCAASIDGQPFLVAATRLGGYHGYDEAGATAPLGGAVSGFTKAYQREQPDALVKVVDVPAGRDATAVAEPARRRDACATPAASRSAIRTTGCAGPSVSPRHRSVDGDGDKPLDADSVVRGHRCGGQHRLGDHCRPRRGVGRNVPPARPHAGARPGRSATCSASSTDKDGLKSDLAARLKEGGAASDARADREGARPHRAARRRPRGGARRSPQPAARARLPPGRSHRRGRSRRA